MTSEAARNFIDRVRDRSVVFGIIGLGYVGIPLALAALRQGIMVIGFDISRARIDDLNAGRGTFKHIPTEEIAAGVRRVSSSRPANSAGSVSRMRC